MYCRDLHCHLIGYKPKKFLPNMSSISAATAHQMHSPLRKSVGTLGAKMNHGKPTFFHLVLCAELSETDPQSPTVNDSGTYVSGTSQTQVVKDVSVLADSRQQQLTIFNSQDQIG